MWLLHVCGWIHPASPEARGGSESSSSGSWEEGELVSGQLEPFPGSAAYRLFPGLELPWHLRSCSDSPSRAESLWGRKAIAKSQKSSCAVLALWHNQTRVGLWLFAQSFGLGAASGSCPGGGCAHSQLLLRQRVFSVPPVCCYLQNSYNDDYHSTFFFFFFHYQCNWVKVPALRSEEESLASASQ